MFRKKETKCYKLCNITLYFTTVVIVRLVCYVTVTMRCNTIVTTTVLKTRPFSPRLISTRSIELPFSVRQFTNTSTFFVQCLQFFLLDFQAETKARSLNGIKQSYCQFL